MSQDASPDGLSPRPASESRTEFGELVMPHLSNMSGNLHGGELLSRIDKCAAVCAMRHAGCICVTASVDSVDFIEAIKIGEVIRLIAQVNYVGRSSMEVEVKVFAENPTTRVCRHTNSCFVTMVAITDEGRPRPVPPLALASDDERQRFADGERRAMDRKARRKANQA